MRVDALFRCNQIEISHMEKPIQNALIHKANRLGWRRCKTVTSEHFGANLNIKDLEL